MKYHVNPVTGNVNVCGAKRRCPFGEELHFPSEKEAKYFAEKLMSQLHEESETMSKGKLIIYVGVPGSGKSTLAAEKAQETGGTLLNRDDMRTSLFGAKYHDGRPDKKSEAQVSAILRNKLISILRKGGVAIDDNTNTNPRFLSNLIKQALDMDADVEIITVNTPLEEAKRRNRKRGATGGRLVPEHVIDQMASKLYSEDGNIKDVLFNRDGVMFVDKFTAGYELIRSYSAELQERYPILSKDVVLVDIDGTLSFNHDALQRNITGPNIERKDWQGFFRDSAKAPANRSVLSLLHRIRSGGLTIFALTGRQDDSAEHTIDFLKSADAPISRLLMARQGDFRGDYSTKSTALQLLESEGYTVVHSIDDRPSSIRVWEDNGIMVSRVPEPTIGDDSVAQEPTVNSFIGGGFCLKCGLDIDGDAIIHDSCRSEDV